MLEATAGIEVEMEVEIEVAVEVAVAVAIPVAVEFAEAAIRLSLESGPAPTCATD